MIHLRKASIDNTSTEDTLHLYKVSTLPLNCFAGGDEDEDEGKEGTLIPGDADSTRHKPAENLTQKNHEDKMRERLAKRKGELFDPLI